jgi:hypothetical protein
MCVLTSLPLVAAVRPTHAKYSFESWTPFSRVRSLRGVSTTIPRILDLCGPSQLQYVPSHVPQLHLATAIIAGLVDWPVAAPGSLLSQARIQSACSRRCSGQAQGVGRALLIALLHSDER